MTNTNTAAALAAVNQHAHREASRQCLSTDDATISRLKLEEGLRKDFADPNNGNVRRSGRIITNYLSMNPPQRLFVYQLEMIRTVQNGQTVLVRKRVDQMKIMDIVEQNVAQLRPMNGSVSWATDGDLIWSTLDLFNVQALQPQPVARITNPAVNLTYRNECGTQLTIQEVNIYFHRLIAIAGQSVTQLFHDPTAQTIQSSTPDILVRGLNAFLTKHARAAPANTFTNSKKGYQPRLTPAQTQPHWDPQLSANNAGGDLILAREGLFVSTRPGIDRLLININTICSPFLGQQNLQTFIDSTSLSAMQLSPVMKGVRVRITFPIHGGWNPDLKRYRFIKKIAAVMSCHNDQHGAPVPVRTCFTNNSGAHRIIRPSNAPAVTPGSWFVEVVTNMRPGANAPPSEFYPAGVLEIAPHQPYHGPLEGNEISSMVNFARTHPQASYSKIMNAGLGMFGLLPPGQNGLANFGNMIAGQQMLEIPGHWLRAPTIRYGGANPNQYVSRPPNDAQWNLVGVRFVQRNVRVHELRFVDVRPGNSGGSEGSSSQSINSKRQYIARALQTHGLLANVQQPWLVNDPKNIDLTSPTATQAFENSIWEKLHDNYPSRPRQSPVLVAISRRSIPMYSYLKRVADLRLGLNTIVINHQGSRFDDQKGSNIALKYNLKLGQTNHFLDNNSLRAIRSSGQRCDTIVIGADVTHPGKAAIHGTPSIAAVVGSIDDVFMRFPGSMRLQRSRKEYIVELGDMVKERLIDWAEKHGDRLPTNMLFYRDGVSESMYAKLRSYELPQIQQAFNWAQEFLNFKAVGGGHGAHLGGNNSPHDPWPQVANPEPPGRDERAEGVDDLFTDRTGLNTQFRLTYVVVGKRHNTRFYPRDAQNREEAIGNNNGNVRPGLLVDQVITHPFTFDFFLQSHKPITGTGRSAHYIVMQNNMNLSAAQLHSVVRIGLLTFADHFADLVTQTHDLCYAYARATKGVSYCAPAYYADRLCDRGRCYLNHFLSNTFPERLVPARNSQTQTSFQYLDHVKDWLRGHIYYRPQVHTSPGQPPPRKYGFVRRNPWHPNLDDIMFYL